MVRDTFLEVGGFEEGLFPNEENELIDRYLQRGHRLAYSPSLATQRPVDTNLLNHWQRMWRYGQGRARQWKRRPSWYGSQHFFFLAILPLCFFLFLGFSQAWFLAKAIAFAYAVWLIAAGCDGLRRYRKLLFFFFAGIGIAGTHAAYTLGYWSGLLGRNCLPDGYFQGVVVNRFHA